MSSLFPSMTLRSTMSLAIALAVTAGACNCEESGFRDAEPRIVVNPESFSIDGVPGKFTEHILEVSNEGSSALRVSKVELLNDAGEEHTKYAIVQEFVEDCAQEIRPAEGRQDILQSSCAIIRFRYLPTDDGIDNGTIIIHSNDPETPALKVPINGNSQTPTIEVCAYEGDTEIGCNNPGYTFEVDFGLSAIGADLSRTLKIKSKGSRAVDIEELILTGDADFSVTPDTYKGSLEPGEEETFTVNLKALAGGSRDARLVIANNDPIDERLEVRLSALGDASKICLCVENSAGRCVKATEVDFGLTTVGGVGTKVLGIASCGTKDLVLTKLELEGKPPFGATFPALPTTLPPNSPFIEIPVTFSPTSFDFSEGRIHIESTEETGGFAVLMGEGYDGGCKLKPSVPTLDFGSVAINYAGEKRITFVNQGDEPCVVKGQDLSNPVAGAHISAGADVEFSIAGVPTLLIVPPSATLAFTLAYKPADLNGPDVGEFTVPYSGESGSPIRETSVQLKGTPVAEPKCTLVAQPGHGSSSRKLHFGVTRINQMATDDVVFTNTGSGPCKINNPRIANSGMPVPGQTPDRNAFSIESQPQSPLPPSASTTIKVGFKPDADRGYGSGATGLPQGFPIGSVSLMVNTDDVDSFPADGGGGGGGFPLPGGGGGCAGLGGTGAGDGCVAWDLAGMGAKSDLVALPYELDFGLVTFGCHSREETITLYNSGALAATIYEINIDPVKSPAVFKVQGPQLPYTLSGGAPLELKVRYMPRAETGVDEANVIIVSDATNATNGEIVVAVRGEATTDTFVKDVFDKGTQPKTDVLFVIDDSGSMGEEQKLLGDNASLFITVAESLDTDFQVGVVTTDVEKDPGQFRGSPKIIKSTDTDPAGKLKKTVQDLGTGGSADERALESMVAALSPPNISAGGTNEGFLRSDAKLAVIAVGDEDDHSNGSVNFYKDFLKNIKGIHNAGMVSFSTITGPRGGCQSSNGDAEFGARLVAVQEDPIIGGSFFSICDSDWGQIAADMGLDAFGAQAGFPLSREAIGSSITVEVNESPVVQPAWAYEVLPNNVVFKPETLPEPGESVVIEYEAFCHTGSF